MAAAKKAVTKTVSKKAAKPDDNIYWVVSVRNKLFGWTPKFVFKTYELAAQERRLIELDSFFGGIGYNGAKVDRVTLETA